MGLIRRLNVTQRAMERAMLGLSLRDRIRKNCRPQVVVVVVGPHRRSGEGRGKPLYEGSTEPIVVENFGEGLCPAVDVSRLR
jgi:hypothetical protein